MAFSTLSVSLLVAFVVVLALHVVRYCAEAYVAYNAKVVFSSRALQLALQAHHLATAVTIGMFLSVLAIPVWPMDILHGVVLDMASAFVLGAAATVFFVIDRAPDMFLEHCVSVGAVGLACAIASMVIGSHMVLSAVMVLVPVLYITCRVVALHQVAAKRLSVL